MLLPASAEFSQNVNAVDLTLLATSWRSPSMKNKSSARLRVRKTV
jgi:hypothetical protein